MKILALLLCVSLLVGTVSADCQFTPNVPSPSGGAIHSYEKGTLSIPISNSIRAWQYEDIEITAVI